MTIDFFTNVDAEFLIERLQVRRQVKIRIDACGGVFRRRHHMHTPGNTEPPLFPIKTSEAVSALEMHDRESLVRSLRINIDGKMLAAECGNRSLLHAARDFLERIGPPVALRYLSRSWSALGNVAFASPGFFSSSAAGWASSSMMMGVATGSLEPRWQE